MLERQSGGTHRKAAPAPLVVWFEQLGAATLQIVGGKNASLGEMVRHLTGQGVKVPAGFATTADAYWRFVDANELRGIISSALTISKPARSRLRKQVRRFGTPFCAARGPMNSPTSIAQSYQELCRRSGKIDPDVAVRSSATAEDLPDASFAGQQESFLNIRGVPALLDACRRCYASLFTDRAIAYRQGQGLRSSEGRAFDRHPEHGALGSRRRRRDVLDRHRDRIRQGRRHQRGLGARRKRRAGRRRSRRISDLQAALVRSGAGPDHREDDRRQGAENDLCRRRRARRRATCRHPKPSAAASCSATTKS